MDEIGLTTKDGGAHLVRLSRNGASLCGTLVHWLEDCDSRDGTFPVPFSRRMVECLAAALEQLVHTEQLAPLGDFSSPGCELGSLRHRALIFGVMATANYLDAPQLLQRHIGSLAVRLFFKGRSVTNLRRQLDVSPPIGGSSQDHREPIFTPPSKDSAAVGGDDVARWAAAAIGDDDTILSCLAWADALTLRTLKLISPAWRERARELLGNPASAWRQRLGAGEDVWVASGEWVQVASSILAALATISAALQSAAVDERPTQVAIACEHLYENVLPAFKSLGQADRQVTLPAVVRPCVQILCHPVFAALVAADDEVVRAHHRTHLQLLRHWASEQLAVVDPSVLSALLCGVDVRALATILAEPTYYLLGMTRTTQQEVAVALGGLEPAALIPAAAELFALTRASGLALNALHCDAAFDLVARLIRDERAERAGVDGAFLGQLLAERLDDGDIEQKLKLLCVLQRASLLTALPLTCASGICAVIRTLRHNATGVYCDLTKIVALLGELGPRVLLQPAVLEAMMDVGPRIMRGPTSVAAWGSLVSRHLFALVPSEALAPHIEEIVRELTAPLSPPSPTHLVDMSAILIAHAAALPLALRKELRALCDSEATHGLVRGAAKDVLRAADRLARNAKRERDEASS
uniref:Uncharacterized protein n=1 Tax=Emiliania huxleyi TaxID=2903 RepID=A0A7S3WTL5_EMIHU